MYASFRQQLAWRDGPFLSRQPNRVEAPLLSFLGKYALDVLPRSPPLQIELASDRLKRDRFFVSRDQARLVPPTTKKMPPVTASQSDKEGKYFARRRLSSSVLELPMQVGYS